MNCAFGTIRGERVKFSEIPYRSKFLNISWNYAHFMPIPSPIPRIEYEAGHTRIAAIGEIHHVCHALR